jgi:hypothetical protein
LGGCFFLSAAPPFYIGLAIPLIFIGIVQMTVGATIARRTDRQAEDLEKLLAEDPSEFSRQEMPRMASVMRSFVVYRWAEISIAAVGLVLILLNQEVNFWKGLGAGKLAQAMIMLVFDFFAEKRGHQYSAFVKSRSSN